jgi:ribosome maturation factor RimP
MMALELTENYQCKGKSDISPPDSQFNQNPTRVQVAPGSAVEKIQAVALPILQSLRLDLFSLEFSGSILRIFIDKTEGVTLDECANASRHLGRALEVEELIPGSYTLEVSSPGLDRPLRNLDDYRRFEGNKVRIKTAARIEGQKTFVGWLLGTEAEIVSVSLSDGRKVAIPFDQIERARLEVELPIGRSEGGK